MGIWEFSHLSQQLRNSSKGGCEMAWWLKADEYYGPYFDWVDEDAVAERRGLVGSGMSLSRPLSAKNVPGAARSRSKAKKPPSPDVFIVAYSVACNQRFKDLVEEFEPGKHLFAPIELQYDDGRKMVGEFYFFNCNVDIDCVLTDNEGSWFANGRDRIISAINSIHRLTPIQLSLSKPQIEGHHLWTGGPIGWNQLFVSNEFADALKKHRIRGTQRWRECYEVDRPWIAEEHMGPLLDKWRAYVAADRNCEVGYI
jgi:hypothetical protein